MKKVSIITVNFNQPTVTEELLVSIASTNSYQNIEIILVDNGSTVNLTNEWIQKYPDVKIIRSDENLGFAGGNNLGIMAATGDYLFFVNNDTEFTPGLIGILVNTLEKNPLTGIISPKIRYFHQNQTIQYAGFTPINYLTGRNKCIGKLENDNGQYDRFTGVTGYVHGAAMMIRKDILSQVGLMNEKFFLYYEEMDWCERIKQAGYEIWIAPEALIYHKESISVGNKSPLKEFFMTRNRILFIRRNAPILSCFIFYLYFSGIVTPRNILTYIKDKRTDLILPFLKAVFWNLTHRKDSIDIGYPIENRQ